MGRCETCGNEYDKSFTVVIDGKSHIFDSVECASAVVAPTCETCHCHILGHGMEADGKFYCSAHCAREAGIGDLKDRETASRDAEESRGRMTAAQILTPDPVCADAGDSIEHVSELLFSHGIRHVPILRNGELLGMVSDRDIRSFTLPLDEQVDDPQWAKARLQLSVSEICHTDVLTIEPDAPLDEIVDLMIDERVGALPVVERSGRLVGIVSYIDVLKVLQNQGTPRG